MLYDVFLNDRFLGRVAMAPFEGRAVITEAICMLVMHQVVFLENGCRVFKIGDLFWEEK